MPRLTRILGLTGTAILLVIVGIQIYSNYIERQRVEQLFPKLEELISIYSLVAWKKNGQQAPLVKENGFTSDLFRLECSNIDWDSESMVMPGDLLDCLSQPKEVLFQGEYIPSYNVVPNVDFWYQFRWPSLFGYEFEVNINLHPLASERFQEEIKKEFKEPCASYEDFSDEVIVYSFELHELTAAGKTRFDAVSHHIECAASGAAYLVEEWVYYIDDEPVSAAQLNRFIQIIARQMQISDVDLSIIAPKLEVVWRNRDKTFISGVLDSVSGIPDLSKIGDFLNN